MISPLQPKKWNAHFWIMFNFWWSAGLVNGLKPHPPHSSQKNEIACFWITFNFWWLARAGWWTQPHAATPLQPKKWNAHFWITFNFWWSAGLVNGLESHLPPLSNQKNEMLIFGLRSTSDDQLATLVNGIEPHLQPLSNQKSEMLVFGLCSTSDDWPGWSLDCKLPFGSPLKPKKWKCSFLDYMFNFWWSAGLVDGLKPHLPPLSNQKWNAHFCIMFNFWWSAWLVNGLKPHCHPSPTKKMKCSFLYYAQLLMISQAGWWTRTPSATLSPAIKKKCSFLHYVQLLTIGWAGQWTQTAVATLLQPKKWNAHFWITFNFWWLARLVDGLKPHLPPLSGQKN